MTTPFSSMLLVLFASVIGSIGAVFLKLGAIRLTDLWGILNWRVGAGVALYVGSSFFYGWGIKNGQLSVLFPMVSLSYVWTLLWGRLVFQEQITARKFTGVGIILIGVVLVGLGSK